jgi:hypothetical protein
MADRLSLRDRLGMGDSIAWRAIACQLAGAGLEGAAALRGRIFGVVLTTPKMDCSRGKIARHGIRKRAQRRKSIHRQRFGARVLPPRWGVREGQTRR